MKRSKNHRGEWQNRLTISKQAISLAPAELLIFQIRQTSSSRKETAYLPLISFASSPEVSVARRSAASKDDSTSCHSGLRPGIYDFSFVLSEVMNIGFSVGFTFSRFFVFMQHEIMHCFLEILFAKTLCKCSNGRTAVAVSIKITEYACK